MCHVITYPKGPLSHAAQQRLAYCVPRVRFCWGIVVDQGLVIALFVPSYLPMQCRASDPPSWCRNARGRWLGAVGCRQTCGGVAVDRLLTVL